jgi:hypothetical protein
MGMSQCDDNGNVANHLLEAKLSFKPAAFKLV